MCGICFQNRQKLVCFLLLQNRCASPKDYPGFLKQRTQLTVHTILFLHRCNLKKCGHAAGTYIASSEALRQCCLTGTCDTCQDSCADQDDCLGPIVDAVETAISDCYATGTCDVEDAIADISKCKLEDQQMLGGRK
eukprot:sb/3474660/